MQTKTAAVNPQEACLQLQNLFSYYARLRYRLVGDDLDDVMQEASLLLLQNFPKFNGKHLSTFAKWQVAQARFRVGRQRTIGTNRIRKHLEDSARARGEGVECNEVVQHEQAEHDATCVTRVKGLLERLSGPQRVVMTLIYGLDGRPPIRPKDLGRETGTSRRDISQKLSLATSNMRRFVGASCDE